MARNNLVLQEKTKVSQMLPKDLENKMISFQNMVTCESKTIFTVTDWK